MGLSRHEYQNGLPCPHPGDLSDPRIKPTFLTSPALAGRFLFLFISFYFLPLAPSAKPNELVGAMNEVAKTWWNVIENLWKL